MDLVATRVVAFERIPHHRRRNAELFEFDLVRDVRTFFRTKSKMERSVDIGATDSTRFLDNVRASFDHDSSPIRGQDLRIRSIYQAITDDYEFAQRILLMRCIRQYSSSAPFRRRLPRGRVLISICAGTRHFDISSSKVEMSISQCSHIFSTEIQRTKSYLVVGLTLVATPPLQVMSVAWSTAMNRREPFRYTMPISNSDICSPSLP